MFNSDDMEGTRASQIINSWMGIQSDELPGWVLEVSDEEYESSEDETESSHEENPGPYASS